MGHVRNGQQAPGTLKSALAASASDSEVVFLSTDAIPQGPVLSAGSTLKKENKEKGNGLSVKKEPTEKGTGVLKPMDTETEEESERKGVQRLIPLLEAEERGEKKQEAEKKRKGKEKVVKEEKKRKEKEKVVKEEMKQMDNEALKQTEERTLGENDAEETKRNDCDVVIQDSNGNEKVRGEENDKESERKEWTIQEVTFETAVLDRLTFVLNRDSILLRIAAADMAFDEATLERLQKGFLDKGDTFKYLFVVERWIRMRDFLYVAKIEVPSVNRHGFTMTGRCTRHRHYVCRYSFVFVVRISVSVGDFRHFAR